MKVQDPWRALALRFAGVAAALVVATACVAAPTAVVPSVEPTPTDGPLVAGLAGLQGTPAPAAPDDVPTSDATPAAARLTILSKVVNVSRGGSAFAAASDGDMIREGDTVQALDGRAVLTFPDGSTVEIEPKSAMSIDTLELTPDGGIVLSVTLILGKSWHVVAPLAPSSSYEVKTDASVARVKGTEFEVDLDRSGDVPVATVATTEGTVATTAAGASDAVLVTKGDLTVVKKGDARPAAPRPKPAPVRVATTVIEAAEGVVVDALGRANGIVNGRLVLQTPGAHAEHVDGRVVVTLPDPPDGVLTTSLGTKKDPSEPDKVKVETKIAEKSGDAHVVDQTVTRAPGQGAATGVEIAKGAAGSIIREVLQGEKDKLEKPKIAPVPERGTAARTGASSKDSASGAKPGGAQAPEKPSAPQKQPAGPEKAAPPARQPGVVDRPGGSRSDRGKRPQ